MSSQEPSTAGKRIGEQILAGLGVAGALALISWVAPPVQTGLQRVFTCGGTGRSWWWECQGSLWTIFLPGLLSWISAVWVSGYVEGALKRRWDEDHPAQDPFDKAVRYYSSSTSRYEGSPAARHSGIAATWGAAAAGAVILMATLAFGLIPATAYLRFLAR